MIIINYTGFKINKRKEGLILNKAIPFNLETIYAAKKILSNKIGVYSDMSLMNLLFTV